MDKASNKPPKGTPRGTPKGTPSNSPNPQKQSNRKSHIAKQLNKPLPKLPDPKFSGQWGGFNEVLSSTETKYEQFDKDDEEKEAADRSENNRRARTEITAPSNPRQPWYKRTFGKQPKAGQTVVQGEKQLEAGEEFENTFHAPESEEAEVGVAEERRYQLKPAVSKYNIGLGRSGGASGQLFGNVGGMHLPGDSGKP